MTSHIEVIPPQAHVHPEAARFEKQFDQTLMPDETHFEISGSVITGVRENTAWSRLGLTIGTLFALGITGLILIWIPVINILWALVMLGGLLTLPVLCAQAAVFRLRKGRVKTFRLEFSGGSATWQSNDDAFWKPVKAFFELE